MSTALAIAGVTAVLRDLLNDGLINHDVSSVTGNAVNVSVLSPDRVVPREGGAESSQINLFLYLVTPNAGWRNERLPSRDAGGRQRLANAPLALDLHYLLSVYSGGDLHAEILLGYAMQLLHEVPVLTREAIRTALKPSPAAGTGLPAALLRLAESGLADQIEQIRLTPQVLDIEEMSKLWAAIQSPYRPTAAYVASVVLIEAQRPVRAPLPVLSRGIQVAPGLRGTLPMLTSVEPPAGQPVAGHGDTVALRGHQLGGSVREVRLVNDRFRIDMVLPALAPPASGADTLVEFALDSGNPAELLPVGVYGVSVRVQRPGEAQPRESNRMALTLAPRVTNLPLTVQRDPDGSADVGIDFEPPLRDGQHARLVLGQHEHEPAAPAAPGAGTLAFRVEDAQPGEYLARLRVDGIDSPVVDRSASPPAWLDRRVVIQ